VSDDTPDCEPSLAYSPKDKALAKAQSDAYSGLMELAKKKVDYSGGVDPAVAQARSVVAALQTAEGRRLYRQYRNPSADGRK
jgi:hypothetical protein